MAYNTTVADTYKSIRDDNIKEFGECLKILDAYHSSEENAQFLHTVRNLMDINLLQYCVYYDRQEFTRLLLDHGFPINLRYKSVNCTMANQSALTWALWLGLYSHAEMLLTYGASSKLCAKELENYPEYLTLLNSLQANDYYFFLAAKEDCLEVFAHYKGKHLFKENITTLEFGQQYSYFAYYAKNNFYSEADALLEPRYLLEFLNSALTNKHLSALKILANHPDFLDTICHLTNIKLIAILEEMQIISLSGLIHKVLCLGLPEKFIYNLIQKLSDNLPHELFSNLDRILSVSANIHEMSILTVAHRLRVDLTSEKYTHLLKFFNLNMPVVFGDALPEKPLVSMLAIENLNGINFDELFSTRVLDFLENKDLFKFMQTFQEAYLLTRPELDGRVEKIAQLLTQHCLSLNTIISDFPTLEIPNYKLYIPASGLFFMVTPMICIFPSIFADKISFELATFIKLLTYCVGTIFTGSGISVFLYGSDKALRRVKYHTYPEADIEFYNHLRNYYPQLIPIVDNEIERMHINRIHSLKNLIAHYYEQFETIQQLPTQPKLLSQVGYFSNRHKSLKPAVDRVNQPIEMKNQDRDDESRRLLDETPIRRYS